MSDLKALELAERGYNELYSDGIATVFERNGLLAVKYNEPTSIENEIRWNIGEIEKRNGLYVVERKKQGKGLAITGLAIAGLAIAGCVAPQQLGYKPISSTGLTIDAGGNCDRQYSSFRGGVGGDLGVDRDLSEIPGTQVWWDVAGYNSDSEESGDVFLRVLSNPSFHPTRKAMVDDKTVDVIEKGKIITPGWFDVWLLGYASRDKGADYLKHEGFGGVLGYTGHFDLRAFFSDDIERDEGFEGAVAYKSELERERLGLLAKLRGLNFAGEFGKDRVYGESWLGSSKIRVEDEDEAWRARVQADLNGNGFAFRPGLSGRSSLKTAHGLEEIAKYHLGVDLDLVSRLAQLRNFNKEIALALGGHYDDDNARAYLVFALGRFAYSRLNKLTKLERDLEILPLTENQKERMTGDHLERVAKELSCFRLLSKLKYVPAFLVKLGWERGERMSLTGPVSEERCSMDCYIPLSEMLLIPKIGYNLQNNEVELGLYGVVPLGKGAYLRLGVNRGEKTEGYAGVSFRW